MTRTVYKLSRFPEILMLGNVVGAARMVVSRLWTEVVFRGVSDRKRRTNCEERGSPSLLAQRGNRNVEGFA